MRLSDLEKKWDALSKEWYEFSYKEAKNFLKPKGFWGKIFNKSSIAVEMLIGGEESVKLAYRMGAADTLCMLQGDEPYSPKLIKEQVGCIDES